MTDDTNGVPPPPEAPSKYITMHDIERIIERLALPGNVVKNTEVALTDVMPRLERLEDQVKTFAAVWGDSIDTRKKQLDRIEEDLDGYSDKIKAISDKLETAINFQVSNDESIRLMKTRYDRDLYGGTTHDGDTIIPGLMSTVKFMSDAITKQNELLRLIERRLESEEELTARYKAREKLVIDLAKSPLVVRLLAAGGVGTIIAQVLKVLGG